MDLPAFALHAESLRRKFYSPKPVLRSRDRALVFEGERVFGEDYMCGKQASAQFALELAGTFKFYSSQIGASALHSPRWCKFNAGYTCTHSFRLRSFCSHRMLFACESPRIS